MNIMILLEMAAQANPDRIAIGSLDGGLTYGRLFELAGGLASDLRARGDAAPRLIYTDEATPALPVALFGVLKTKTKSCKHTHKASYCFYALPLPLLLHCPKFS